MSCSAEAYVSLGGSNGCADRLTNWYGTPKTENPHKMLMKNIVKR